MNGLKHPLKIALGTAAAAAFPHLAREIDEGQRHDNARMLKRLMTYSRIHRPARDQDRERIEAALRQYWAGVDGDRFHDNHRDARYRHFLEHHADIVEELRRVIAADPARFRRVVEVGCGDGHVLCYAAGRLPEIEDFVGIDINARVIREAELGTECPKTRYVAGDALDWLAETPRPGTVVVTAGGVLEYFSPARVACLFRQLAAHTPAAAVLIEPLAPGHDIAMDTDSRLFGRENSFSHPYPVLLARAGFRVLWSREMEEGGRRWLLILATSDGVTGTEPR